MVKSDGDPLHAEAIIRSAVATATSPCRKRRPWAYWPRSSRVATNVYETLMAARGKPVLFFPARFDMHEVQAADGYAYNIAIQRFNTDFRSRSGPSSRPTRRVTGGAARVAVPWRAAIAPHGRYRRAMMQFSRILPARIPHYRMVDFNNDSVLTLRTGSDVPEISAVMRPGRPGRSSEICFVRRSAGHQWDSARCLCGAIG